MTSTPRRKFIKKSIGLGAMIPFIGNPVTSSVESFTQSDKLKKKASKPMKILILGGTSFLGPNQIAYALEQGHEISTFTRGKTVPTIHKKLFSKVESLIGDREDNLEALKGRKWDVVIDNSGRKVAWTKATAELLKDHADLYMYVSSISVFYPYTGTDFSEERDLVREIPSELESEDEKMNYDYGVMKANSELAAMEAFGPERTTVIRPTFIVGKGDRTNRFAYWPVRLSHGGEVMVPGKADDLVQYIDVRDLSSWMIRLCEDRVGGIFNAAGPGWPMTMRAFVHGGHAAFNTPVSYVYVDDHEFLQEKNSPFFCPWVLPSGKYAGMSKAENAKAIAHGLTFRPLSDTMKATYDWWMSEAVEEERRKSFVEGEEGILEQEKKIIAEWKKRSQ